MHVTEVEILLYIEDKLPPEDRKKLEAHVSRCDDCIAQFSAFARLSDVLGETIQVGISAAAFKRAVAVVASQKSTGGWSFGHVVSPLRVSLATLVVIGIVWTTYILVSPQQASEFRSTENSLTRFTLSPPDGAELNESTPTFHWTPVARTSVYNFNLMNESGVTVWNWDVRDTMVILPSSVVLLPGKTYLWRVESFLADKTHERSALHVFTYVPSK